MVNFCAVYGCSNYDDRDKKSFFRLPAVIAIQCEKKTRSFLREDPWSACQSLGEILSNLPTFPTLGSVLKGENKYTAFLCVLLFLVVDVAVLAVRHQMLGFSGALAPVWQYEYLKSELLCQQKIEERWHAYMTLQALPYSHSTCTTICHCVQQQTTAWEAYFSVIVNVKPAVRT